MSATTGFLVAVLASVGVFLVAPTTFRAVLTADPTAAPPPVPGVKVTRTQWLSDRRVALWIYSPAMGSDIQVQLLLARDWNYDQKATFPQLYSLDGLRAQDNESGWTINTDIVDFYKDKNVNVVLPVGGESSFYTDWKGPDNGKNYKWETFLTKELPPVLQGQWRSSGIRGVQGLSMGGSAAMMLASRNPGFFKFAASYSGILQLSSFGMPQAVQFAINDAGGFDSAQMFGPPTDPAWKEHDPFLLIGNLKGTSLYLSSGNGMLGQYDTPSTLPGLASNYSGVGLEVLSRVTSQQFATKLNQLGIAAQAVFRPSGTHTWPYWNFEMKQAWPQAASALAVSTAATACSATGAIAAAAAVNKSIGDCLTPEYAVAGGRAQDFDNGRILWSAATGAHIVGGAIGGAYVGSGGPGGSLGFPTTDESVAPDRAGRFNQFENGSIYWSPTTGAHPLSGSILEAWAKAGYERGPVGYPVSDETDTPNGKGRVQGFQVGGYWWNQADGANAVQGKILSKYAKLGYESGWLGFPKSSEAPLRDNGRYNAFDGGYIYWTPANGAFAIPAGPLFDAWAGVGYENGKLGYPISDQIPITGGYRVNFEHGSVEVVNGVATVR